MLVKYADFLEKSIVYCTVLCTFWIYCSHPYCIVLYCIVLNEELEDTKGVITIGKSKTERQHNG